MTPAVSQSKNQAEPAWDVALLYPDQGQWTVDEYFALTDSTSRLVEFDNGRIEVLEWPTEAHQFILQYLFLALHEFVSAGKLGSLVFAPLRVYTIAEKYREPDIAFMLAEHRDRRSNAYWTGADLVMEVVSDSSESRERDLAKKREEYAAAAIPEYWIVDPMLRQIIVLKLEGHQYQKHGTFVAGQSATSVLLDGFTVDVAGVFAAVATDHA